MDVLTILLAAACVGIGMAIGSLLATLQHERRLAVEFHKGVNVGYRAGLNEVAPEKVFETADVLR